MKAIKFTLGDWDSYEAEGPNGEHLELCKSIVSSVVKLPAKCETIYVVPLKRKGLDTLKLEAHRTDLYLSAIYFLVDGERTEFEYDTAKFVRQNFFKQGITNFRIEY